MLDLKVNTDDIESVNKKIEGGGGGFISLIFEPKIPVMVGINAIEPGVATNGSNYIRVNGKVLEATKHGNEMFNYTVFEKSTMYESELPCPLVTLLSQYFTSAELIEGRHTQDKELITRMVGTRLQLMPKKPYFDKQGDQRQNFYGFVNLDKKIVEGLNHVNGQHATAGVVSGNVDTTQEVPF